jgi:CubicO group peptidase (beta-lactamase class C family)
MTNQKDESPIWGYVYPGYEEVRAQFEKNFTIREELGAACTIYYRGEKVVDLWGGYRDEVTHTMWEENTIVIVSSTTKGLAAITLAVALSRGLLELDEHIAIYWPEFAQQGKGKITLRQLMAHQAGLCALDKPLSFEEACDLDRRAEILARQKPAWEPGTRQGYHAVTLGWYLSEIIRRVDPQHRALGVYFQDEIAKPLGLEFYIGLPEEIPDLRIATVSVFGLSGILRGLSTMPLQTSLGFFAGNSYTKRAFETPTPKIADEVIKKRQYIAVDGPAYNGIGTARSIARVYSALVSRANELALKPGVLQAFIQPAPSPRRGRRDEVLKIEIPFSLGCCKPSPRFRFGTSDRAFGMPGLGGSLGYADPDAQIGFGYTPNRWHFSLLDDPRARALRLAFHRCIGFT